MSSIVNTRLINIMDAIDKSTEWFGTESRIELYAKLIHELTNRIQAISNQLLVERIKQADEDRVED